MAAIILATPSKATSTEERLGDDGRNPGRSCPRHVRPGSSRNRARTDGAVPRPSVRPALAATLQTCRRRRPPPPHRDSIFHPLDRLDRLEFVAVSLAVLVREGDRG